MGDGSSSGFSLADLSGTPRLRSSLHPVPLGEDKVVLVGDGEHHLISDRATALVISLMDGRRSALDIIAAASFAVPDVQVLRILATLEARGLLAAAAYGLSEDTAAFLKRAGIPADAFARYAGDSPLSLTALGDALPVELVQEALLRLGLHVETRGELQRAPRYQVVVTDDVFMPELRELHLGNRARGVCWFLVDPTGSAPFVSPLFRPKAGPCFACLEFWMGLNRPVETYLRRKGIPLVPGSRPVFEPAARVIAEVAALTAARMISGEIPAEAPAFLAAFDLSSSTVVRHAVHRRPQCPTCGDPSLMKQRGERPIALGHVPKGPWDDGGYRRRSPAESYRRLASFVSPVTGAVSHLGPMPGRNTGQRAVYLSGYRVVPRRPDVDADAFQRVCAGKGRSSEQARMSALGEAIERFSSVCQGDEATLLASSRELGEAAVSPASLLNFSERQYGERDAEADERASFRAPLRAGPDTRMAWTPAWSLTHRRRRYLPLSYCYAETPPERGAAYCPYIGNGASAGTCLEEAVCQGLFELIERDATAIWWYNRLPRPGVDIASFDDAYCSGLEREYRRHGLSLWVLDLTGDLGVPVYAALAHNERLGRFSVGLGCHLRARVAVSRALTELNQVFDPQGELRPPWETERLGAAGFLFPADMVAAPAEPPSVDGGDLLDDIDVCLHRLESAGLELIAVDKTRPDIGLSVVHVAVPGLRHFRPCFGPGRLYTVPVAMGWREHELSEHELNPVPLLL